MNTMFVKSRVGARPRLLKVEYLSDDLRRAQAAHQTTLRGQTKAAAQGAANLRGDANCPFVAARYQHRFDPAAVLSGKEQLLGAVFASPFLHQGQRADIQLLLKAVPQRLRQIGHFLHAGGLPLVDPLADLTGTKIRLSLCAEKGGNLVAPQVPQVRP